METGLKLLTLGARVHLNFDAGPFAPCLSDLASIEVEAGSKVFDWFLVCA